MLNRASKLQQYLLWWTKCFLELLALQDPAQVSVGHLVHRKAGKHKPILKFKLKLLWNTVSYLTFKLRASINITLFQKHGPEVEDHHWNQRIYIAAKFLHLLVVNLLGGRFTPSPVKIVQLTERTLCPNAEASNMATRSKSQQIHFVHVL